MQKIKNILFNRVVFVILAILIQLFAVIVMIWRFSNYLVIFDVVFTVISILAMLYIINSSSDFAYKTPWIILILLFPIFGGLFYLMVGGTGLSGGMKKKMLQITDKMKENLSQSNETMDLLRQEDIIAFNQSRYIEKYSLCPVYDNSSTEFFQIGRASCRERV